MLVWLLFLAGAAAQNDELRNPRTTPADVEAGARIYRSHCSECHGRTGTGGRGPDLTAGNFRHAKSDSDLLILIMRGVPGTEMPGIYMEDQQVWQVVSFLRSLSSASAPRLPAGNAAEGEKIARGKGACLACHSLNGQGARAGPDLSDAGGRRSIDFLRDSLLQPDKTVSPQWWQHTVRLRSGERVLGLRLNEDTWSFQMLDDHGSLRSFARSEIESISVNRKSTMPAATNLTAAELDNVLAWLSQLRKR